VTKFVGKFRKNQDYNEDYEYAKNVLHNKKRNNEHSEVKKLKVQERKKFDLFDEYVEKD
jgi:hypothetical protein